MGHANTDTERKLRCHKHHLTTEDMLKGRKARRRENICAHAHAIGEPINPARVPVHVEGQTFYFMFIQVNRRSAHACTTTSINMPCLNYEAHSVPHDSSIP